MIQDIYKKITVRTLGNRQNGQEGGTPAWIWLENHPVGDTGALIRLLLRRLLAGRHDRGILTTRIPHERCRDPLHHKRNLHDGG